VTGRRVGHAHLVWGTSGDETVGVSLENGMKSQAEKRGGKEGGGKSAPKTSEVTEECGVLGKSTRGSRKLADREILNTEV